MMGDNQFALSTSNSISSGMNDTLVSSLESGSLNTAGEIKPRKGGDKERRLYRRHLPDSGLKTKDLEGVFAIRIGNIPSNTKFEEVLEECRKFGPIADSYRPMDFTKHRPSPFAFVRFSCQQDGLNCIASLDGMEIGTNRDKLAFTDGNLQDSYFTQDTGYITNERFDTVKRVEDNFDPSLPANHWEVKRKLERANADRVYSIKVEDLNPEITVEQLEDLFSEFGEIAKVYQPMDLRHMCPKPMGIAFIRYTHLQDALDAVKKMHNVRVGPGRRIQVTMAKQQTYFGQDESPLKPAKA